MMNNEVLNSLFEHFMSLNEDAIFSLSEVIEEKTFDSHEVFVLAGQFNYKIGYIKKGLVRVFYPAESGEDITTLLRWENQFVGSYDTTIMNKASRFTYQCIEETEMLLIDFKILSQLVETNPSLVALNNKFLHAMIFEAMERIETFTLLNPEERYLHLLQQNPEIANRVPDKYIATMLGVTAVSLSRIKKRLLYRLPKN